MNSISRLAGLVRSRRRIEKSPLTELFQSLTPETGSKATAGDHLVQLRLGGDTDKGVSFLRSKVFAIETEPAIDAVEYLAEHGDGKREEQPHRILSVRAYARSHDASVPVGCLRAQPVYHQRLGAQSTLIASLRFNLI